MTVSFKQFLINEQKTIYFTFGRMNPPTVGHGKLFDKLAEMSGKNEYRIFLSTSHDSNRNPLLYEAKVKYCRKMFPKHGRNIIKNDQIHDILEAASCLYDEGYKHIIAATGEDRRAEFDILLNKYNGIKGKHGFYIFETIKVKSIGKRTESGTLLESISSTKLRNAAKNEDFVTFSQGVSNKLNTEETQKLFNDVRKGLNLNEITSFKSKIDLKPISETREQYIEGNLFKVNDQVVIKETEEVGTVSVLGANYIIVELSDGTKKRKWLNAVEKLN